MDLQKFELAATALLASFLVSTTLAGFLYSSGNSYWVAFAVLGLSSLVASYMLGSE